MKKLSLLILLAATVSTVQAQVIPVTNGDFEQGTYGSGGYSYNVGTYTGEPNFTLVGDSSGDINGAVYPAGGNTTGFGFIGGSGFIRSGNLATIVAGDSYVLSIEIGVEPDATSGATTLSLQANGVSLSVPTGNGMAPSVTSTATNLPDGSFSYYTVTLTSAETADLMGSQQLTLFGSVAGAAADQTLFDNVTLTQFAPNSGPAPTVPEPSTWALMLGGFGMLICFQSMLRKRSNS